MTGWGRLGDILEEAKQRKLAEVSNQQRLTGPKPPAPAEISAQQPINPTVTSRVAVAVAPPRPVAQFKPPQANDPRPPLPTRMPGITPVADLKNRTAQHQQYSPIAAKSLYETPVHVRYGDSWTDRPDARWPGHSGSEGVGGWYHPDYYGDERIQVNGQRGQTTLDSESIRNQDSVLAHEFAHKWYRNEMSPELRSSWDNSAADVVQEWIPKHVAAQYDNPNNTSEMFAFNAEAGPWEINPQVRDHYYEGMYRDDVRAPRDNEVMRDAASMYGFSPENWVNEKGIAAYMDYGRPISHEEMESWDERPWRKPSGTWPKLDPWAALQRENPGSGTEYWVKEEGAPLGYHEDGGAKETSRPYPAQWEQPRFPSVRLYNETVPQFYGRG